MTELPLLLKVSTIARHYDMSKTTVYQMINDGVFGPKDELPTQRGQYRVPRGRVLAWAQADKTLEGSE